MLQRVFGNKVNRIALGLLVLVLGGTFAWAQFLARPAQGEFCRELNEAEATEGGKSYNHQSMSSLRDPVNGVLVVTAVGDAFPSCKQAFATFRCTVTGPATLRLQSDGVVAFFEVPEGQTAIAQGNGSGAMRCVLGRG